MTLTIALLEAGRRLFRLPDVWQQRVHTRARLAALSQRQLRDIGLDPEMVAREAQRPFWQPLGTRLGEGLGDAGGAIRLSSLPAGRQLPPALHHASRFAAVALPWRS